MNTYELVDWVETDLRRMGLTPPGPADILLELDRANKKLCADMGIPRRYIKDVATGAPFAPPSEAVPGSISFVERTSTNKRITILTVAEANDQYPDWESNALEGGNTYPWRLVIYDPGNLTAPVYPIGFLAGETLRMEYVVIPKTLVFSNPSAAEATEPYDGLFSQFHRIVAQLAVFKIGMDMMPDDPNTAQVLRAKTQAYYNDAKGDMETMFAMTRPKYYLPNGRLILNIMPGGDA